MNLHEQQLWSDEQRAVIRRLAESATKEDCLFLEVGSWCGDSTVVIGKVVKENGGHLICVDWWKGNPGTELFDIAMDNNIYNAFWERISAELLSDTVIPVRAESGIASSIMKEKSFDFIFLDGDHRYEGVQSDIKKYMPLVKEGGILCGHDCEGYIDDFGRGFLESGKLTDYHEGVHCGVVLAVGESFEDYSINESIWSVKMADGQWKPTIESSIDDEHRQAVIPPLGFIRKYNCYRFKKKIYAVPFSNNDNDIRKGSVRNDSSVVSADSTDEIEIILGDKLKNQPFLADEYKRYNLVKYNNHVFGILQSSGDFDLIDIEEEKLRNLIEEKAIVIGNSLGDTIELIEAIAAAKSDPLSEIEYILNDLRDGNKFKKDLKKIYSEVSDYQTLIKSLSTANKNYKEDIINHENKIINLENNLQSLKIQLEKHTFKQIQFVESVEDFNIVLIDGMYTAISKSVGTIDIEKFKLNNKNVGDLIFSADNLEDIKEQTKKISQNNYKKAIIIEDYQTLKEALKKKNLRTIINALSKIKNNDF